MDWDIRDFTLKNDHTGDDSFLRFLKVFKISIYLYIIIKYFKHISLRINYRGFGDYVVMLIYLFILTVFLNYIEMNLNSFFSYIQLKTQNIEEKLKTQSIENIFIDSNVKKKFENVIDLLLNDSDFTPKGILLYGPPGNGKTSFVRNFLKRYSRISYISITSGELKDKYLGESERNMRELFTRAKSNKPCVIYIDEVDALISRRDQSHEYQRQMTSEFLSAMDGMQGNKGILVIGSTNFEESIDPAALRSGRLELKILLDNPNKTNRFNILKYSIKKYDLKIGLDVDYEELLYLTEGLSGADLVSLVKEVATNYIINKNNIETVNMKDFIDSYDRLVIGIPDSTYFNEDHYRSVAVHEIGHALVALLLGEIVIKVTIKKTDRNLGYTMYKHKNHSSDNSADRYVSSNLLNKIRIALGGKINETLLLGAGNTTPGCSSDYDYATRIAKLYIRYGLDDTPNVYINDRDKDKSVKQLDTDYLKVVKLLDEQYAYVYELLKNNIDKSKNLIKELIDYKEINREQTHALYRGENILLPTLYV